MTTLDYQPATSRTDLLGPPVAAPRVTIGGGPQRSTIELPGAAVAEVPGAEVLDGLGLLTGS